MQGWFVTNLLMAHWGCVGGVRAEGFLPFPNQGPTKPLHALTSLS
jgi:hypothetical protein